LKLYLKEEHDCISLISVGKQFTTFKFYSSFSLFQTGQCKYENHLFAVYYTCGLVYFLSKYVDKISISNSILWFGSLFNHRKRFRTYGSFRLVWRARKTQMSFVSNRNGFRITKCPRIPKMPPVHEAYQRYRVSKVLTIDVRTSV